MPDKNDNLEQLFGGFFNEAEARQAATDLRMGDGLLSEYPARQPNARLLEEIKTEVSRSLAAGRRRAYWVRRAVATAAAVIVIASVLLVWPGAGTTPVYADTAGLWDDTAITNLRAEMDAVLDTMISLETDEYGFDEGAGDFAEVELEELEMVATNDDFWKG